MATFVLVHGACHGGWCWEKVVPILQAHGHTAHAPDLPGLGKDHTPPAHVTLADNVEKISRLLDKTDEPVVLAAEGITDLDKYAYAPGTPLMPDFFVPAPGARTVVGRS